MSDLILSSQNMPYTAVCEIMVSAKNELFIISPYIKADTLNQLVAVCKVKIIVVTSWKVEDLWYGASDLAIYGLSKKHKFPIYINNNIHLKVYISDREKCVFGSANLTGKGMGISELYNYELCGIVQKIDTDALLYFEVILKKSRLLDDALFDEYVKAVKELPDKLKIKEIDLEEIGVGQNFLISALPMSEDTQRLYQLYSTNYNEGEKHEVECAIHDVVLYGIDKDLTETQFFKILRVEFFKSPFIKKFLGFIDEEERYFGRVKEWVQNNCTNVPVPSRRDLTGNIQVLYKWIVELSDGKYRVDRPNHSERIYKS